MWPNLPHFPPAARAGELGPRVIGFYTDFCYNISILSNSDEFRDEFENQLATPILVE